jgi:Glyoxalase/Bleomycin resistance protein/Dioxygenase superfamily
MPDLPLPEALLGDGFYKLGYVVTDRDAAIAELEDAYGFEPMTRFEPTFDAELPDGRVERAELACAFSVGREHVIEVMQPVSGAVELWASVLEGPGPALRFHHFGLVTDDLDAVLDTAARHGLPCSLQAHAPGRFAFSYHEMPALGHLVEHIQYFGDAGAFLASVRSPRSD